MQFSCVVLLYESYMSLIVLKAYEVLTCEFETGHQKRSGQDRPDSAAKIQLDQPVASLGCPALDSF